MRQRRRQSAERRRESWVLVLCAFCVLSSEIAVASTAEMYDPAWIAELKWVPGNAQSDTNFNAPTGAMAYLENKYTPWWGNQVAHPIDDYDGSKLPIGSVRLDGALDVEYTLHRPLKGWTVRTSPSGINNVYGFTPGSTQQQDRTGRSGQNAFFDFGFHPLTNLMGDIGVEAVGNYDQRFWFPLNEEHRMFKDDKHLAVARGELKYDDNTLMVRGFEATPNYNWVYQNDLFELLPTATDVEHYRRTEGTLTPRGGEMRYKSMYGNLDVLGGSEVRFGYRSSVYAKYDAPTRGSWENTLVYRNENIPFSLDPDERRWALSYNSSWRLTDAVSSHVGLLYEPYRVNKDYVEVEGTTVRHKTTHRSDAFGATGRLESRSFWGLDKAGLGLTYLGPVAGNKQQVDVDASRSFKRTWVLSGAYLYRQPVVGPVPLLYEGTASNPGALIANPRGPDDPFTVNWDNRETHALSLTLIYDPTPGTYFFRYSKNILEDYNLNPAEDAPWTAAVQYRVAYYPTNTDRMFYWDEDRRLIYDPIFKTGALATSYPYSSATGLVHWQGERWHVTTSLSGGQALAGTGIAYTSATNFYKPSTTYVQAKLTIDNSVWKAFGSYGQDVWGTEDYEAQLGWAYHRVYQAGLSYIFLRDFETGFRYVGTRMTDEFIGSNIGAFNEYRFFLTYHFGMTIPLGRKYELRGRELEFSKGALEVSLSGADTEFTPDGSGPKRSATLYPRAASESGLYSWKVIIRTSEGVLVKQWEGLGDPLASVIWNGLGGDGQPLPPGSYRATLEVVDRNHMAATSPPQRLEIQSR